MVNRPKAIGTWTESAIVRYLHGFGFGGADEMTTAQRITLHGSTDHGDIAACPGVMLESKGGAAAERASDLQVAAWLGETERERIARGADIAALVRKRAGKGRASAGTWWTHLSGETFVVLATQIERRHAVGLADHAPAVMITLREFCVLLRRAGYGDPFDADAAE